MNDFTEVSELRSRRRVLVAQLGARRHYAVPRALASIGCLEQVVTDACAQVPPWTMTAALPGRWRTGFVRRISERRIEGVETARIRGCLRFTISRQFGTLRRRVGESQTDFWVRQNAAFGRVISALDWGMADTIYAFNGCALEAFREARRRGLSCVLDQTAAPWRYNTTLLAREQQRWPGWESQPADADVGGRMIDREEEEWALADRIVCGSQFVVDAIAAVGGPATKSTVVPYPVPTPPPAPRRCAQDGTTRVLFVGTLQLRKGIQYFSHVAARLTGDRFTFRAVGPSALTPSAETIVRKHVDWRGAVPRSRIWEQYGWADVFLLPTLSEGSANACLEAASSGLPVITSPASGLAPCGTRPILVSSPDADDITATLEALSPRREGNKAIQTRRTLAEYGRDLVGAFAGTRRDPSDHPIES